MEVTFLKFKYIRRGDRIFLFPCTVPHDLFAQNMGSELMLPGSI